MHVVELTAAQVSRVNRVSVLTTAALMDHFDSQVQAIPVRLERSRRNPLLARELTQQFKRLKPDVVHAHANKSAAVVGSIVQKMGIPSVATIHNMKRKQSMYRSFDRVIAVSELVANALALEGIDSSVIRNSIDPPNMAFVENALRLNPPFAGGGLPILYAAGRFVEAKGFDLLLEAMSRIHNAVLWLIGDGPDRAALKRMVEELCLAKRVWMPGFLPREQVLGLMTLADLFVISSRREGGPYTLTEALRYRCPVVSTRVGFAPELLMDDQLCDEVSVAGVEAELRLALADLPTFRESMHPIFQRADRELDIEMMVKKVLAVYAEALAVRQ